MRLQLAALCIALLCVLAPSTASAESPWRIAVDTFFYSDTDNVIVVSPQVAVHHKVDDDGGDVSALVVVDWVSAASVDLVSQATTRFVEVRTEADFAISKRLGPVLPQLGYRFSQEPDYVSHTGSASVQSRLGTADTTASLGARLTLDRIGMTDTPRETFSESMRVIAADMGITQVLGKTTVARLVYGLTVQTGFLEKPYRFVPLFDAAGIAAAQSADESLGLTTFNSYRLPGKPTEEVPDRRVRNAIAARVLQYVPAWKASLRLDYRFYFDSWGMMAHTVGPAFYKEFDHGFRLNVFARMHHQSAVSFWRRVYVVSDPALVPRWRTVDRSLSPYDTLTGGARVEWDVSWLAVYLEGNVMVTRFNDYLFLNNRLAVISQIGLRWRP